MKKIIFSTALLALTASGLSNAGILKPVASNEKCLTSSVQITSITSVEPVGTNIVAENTAINSTSCLGFITYPDNDWGNNPRLNQGGLEDGLLNGEPVRKGKGSNKDEYYVPGDYFLTNDNDSMVNLDGIGEANDPGWIRLGGAETKSEGEWNFQYDSIGSFDIGSVIDELSFSDDGTWTLAVNPSAIPFATAALGRATVFDHLAFVMKGPNKGGKKDGNNDGSWAIFDFNFHDLIDDGLDISLGDTAYKFTGVWDQDLFINDDALSHMSIWAHDPPAALNVPEPSTDVPEPSTLAIFALAIICLASRRLKR